MSIQFTRPWSSSVLRLVGLSTVLLIGPVSPAPGASQPAVAASPAGPALVAVPPAVVLDHAPVPTMELRETLSPYLNTRQASVKDWTPDGAGLIVSTRFGNTSQLHRVDASMGARRQITFQDEPIGNAQSGRDSKGPFVVFSRDVGGNEQMQVYRLDLDPTSGNPVGRPQRLTDGSSRNESFRLTHDGKHLLFSSNARNGKDMDLWIVGVRDPSSRKKLADVRGNYGVLDVAADDKRALVGEYVSINVSNIHQLDLTSGALTAVTTQAADQPVSYMDGRYHPDGTQALVTTDRYGEFRELVSRDLATGRETRLTDHVPWDVEGIEVSAAGNRVAYVVNADGSSRLNVRDLATGRELPLPTLPAGTIGSVSFDVKGTRLAFSHSTARIPSDVFVIDLGAGSLTRWTASEAGGLDPSRWVEPVLVRFPTFDAVDGKTRTIPAFYYRPEGASAQKKAPVIIYIHGGPESQFRPQFSPTMALWVEELGAAVIAPNVRGSAGYGKSYLKLDNGRLREDSVKDIGALLDWIAAQPELDSRRVAVAGGSYGGYMVLASMVHFKDRLACGMDMVGISNFVTFLTSTKEYRRDLRRVEYGDERDPAMRDFLQKISPLTHASEIKAPLLCLQGANDPRVPAGEAEQIVKALRAAKIDAWYMLAKNEGHGFSKKENQELSTLLGAMFFSSHLGRK